uniref:DUF7808 domain-containing protein n=1 Tax=Plectus sambesii TaxID=2011161 RepID=A0A914WDB9_9BILA
MPFSTTAVFCLFLSLSLLSSSFGSQQVFWRYLICKEAWPAVSDNEDAAPEPAASNSWAQPSQQYWNQANPAPAPSAENWGPVPAERNAWITAPGARPPPAPAGQYSVWVPAPSSPKEWQPAAEPSPKWVRAPTPPTRCSLRLDDEPTADEAECFEETQELDGSLRVYCRLHCEQTPFGGEIFFIKEDSENTDCIKYVNYNVELRGIDWYAWRSGSCLKQQISFRARCWPQQSAPITAPVPEPNGD